MSKKEVAIAGPNSEVLTFVPTLMVKRDKTIVFAQPKESTDPEDILSTDSITPEQLLVGLFNADAGLLLNPSTIYAKGTPWYDEAKKNKTDISVAKVLEWLAQEGNSLEFGKFFGKPQLKNPKALKTKSETPTNRAVKLAY